MTYNDLVRELRKLLPWERRALRDMLEHDMQNETDTPKAHLHLADGTDPQEYVNRLRNEWHDRVKIHANSAR